MATCNYIKAKKQNQSAMRAVKRYVSQDAKTLDENGHRYLSGINCLGQAAYDEFMATKNLYGKRSGVYYYHYEQSFAPGEIEDYDTAHKIGLRLAEEMFPGFEVLVGTHLDAHDDDGRQRVHNHFVINSVSYASGMKLDYGPYTIEKMRRISDRLCEEHALSVLPEFKQTFDGKSIGTREYRAAIKGDSWKFKAICVIENAMTRAATKEDFIAIMESEGYSVTWTDSRKYITYTCPNGMKVRDNKLHESKFLKENMQYEFAIRQQTINPVSSFEAEADHSTDNADSDGDSLSAHRVRNPEGRLESVSGVYAGDSQLPTNAFLEISGVGGDRPYKGGLEYADARAQRMGECSWRGGEQCGGQNGEQDAEDPHGKSRTPVTGWEDARIIFLRSAAGDEQPDWSDGKFACEDEEMDPDYAPRKRGSVVRVEFGDLSLDEVSSFFEGEDNAGDDDIDDEFPEEQMEYLLEAEQNGIAYAAYLLGRIYMCGEVVPKNIPEAIRHFEIASARGNHYADYRLGQIYLFEPDFFDMDAALEHLNRSAHAGNECAAHALTQMANDQFLAITTNVLDLVGSLASIESYRQPQDCTTMPRSRKERKKHKREQSM